MFDPDLEDDLKIPTTAIDAEVWLADGSRLEGRLFLPLGAASHAGASRPDERLNDETAFFPLAVEGERRPVLLGKASVVAVVVSQAAVMPSESSEEVLAGSVPPPSVSRTATIFAGDQKLTGVLAVDMPEYKSRAMDYMNRPERFLTLQMRDRLAYVNRALVTKVVES